MATCQGNGTIPPSTPTITIPREPIAIVGIGCRFPGRANDAEAFWGLLERGVDAVTEVPADRWESRAFYDSDPSRPGKTSSRWGGFVEGIDRFDPHFFGISPREAARMDPQQRLLLEVAWEGLEDAGLPLERVAGSRAAVYVGVSSFDYPVLGTSFRDRGGIDAYSNTGGSLSIAANRISYAFDLRGPSAAVDTACSSALVAVHLACRAIWEDGVPMAMAGGVNALLLPDWYVGFSRAGMLSASGRCRAFDAGAGGFVRGEGAGVVVLRPLARALADGDRVYAVIRGTAVNQDGRTPGMTVPSQEAQEALVRAACRDARVAPAAIRYVEAHGTGTPVGDPIEARALGRVLSEGRPPGRDCLVGSVKTNIGHLEAGSGIAGLVKAALALHHGRIPGNLHFERPNPQIDFEALRLRIPTRSEPLPAGDGPALAGVNAFGFGGTNAHVVLQAAPPARDGGGAVGANGAAAGHHPGIADPQRVRDWLVPLSARGPEALRDAARTWAEFVGRCPDDVGLDAIAAGAALDRTHHDHRLAVVAASKPELAERLREYASGRAPAGLAEGWAAAGRRPRVAFVCSGQGPQWWAMGRELLRDEPVFRAAVARCDAIVRRIAGMSLLEELTAEESRSRMAVTAVAQPCLFAIQVALAELWASWGVRPEAVVGHSVGEVAAAYIAGVFSLEDAVRVIVHRGRCMDLAPGRGKMLAAGISADAARTLLDGDARVGLAAVNAPSSVTLSGEAGPLEDIALRLEDSGAFCRFLKVEYAFHSRQMEPIRGELLRALEGIRPGPAALPMISTVTGRPVEGSELGPDYWWANVRETVRFAEGVEGLIDLGSDTVIELGPHPVLAAAVVECYQARGAGVAVVSSLRRHEAERATMLHGLGVLHVHGQAVDWRRLSTGPRRFIRLPLYPWQRERFWHEAEESRASRLTALDHPLLGVRQDGPGLAWEARLDLRLAPYLADHRVQRAALMPAAAYLELAFAAGRAAFGSIGCEVRDVTFSNPCFLAPDQPLRLRTTFDPDSGALRVHTRPVQGDREWTIHLSATLHSRTGDSGAVFSPDAVRSRCPGEFPTGRCYGYFATLGLDYGAAFQGIDRCWQGDRESLGLVRLPDGVERLGEGNVFHPALIDACFQAVIPADADFDHKNGGLYLPHEIDEVRLYRCPGRWVWVHAQLREKTPRRSVSDVDIYDEDGRPVARVRGLRSHRVAGGAERRVDDLLYAYRWCPQPLPAAGAPPGRAGWLIFADEGGTGAALAERLRALGETCTTVGIGPAFEDIGAGRYRINPGREDDVLRLLETVAVSDVVHLWNLDAPAADDVGAATLQAAADAGLWSVIGLVQAWERAAQGRAARLVVVTRGAQSVGERPEPLTLAQSPAVGLGRVVANEYPRLRATLVDLDPAAGADSIEALLAEVLAADDEDEVAIRGAERFVHRFLPAPGLPPEGEREQRPARGDEPYRLSAPRAGTLDGLVLSAASRRPPGPGEVEIEVSAAGLNFSDVMKALGLYPGMADGPLPLGAECAGRVSAVGEGVERVRVGDEVVAVAGFAFGSHVVTPAELVVARPPELTAEAAATLPIAFLTAAYALEHLARLAPGESVLIHSASGGVGLAALQLARRTGSVVFATAGTPEKREYLRSLGVECVMDSRSLDFAELVLERTGGRGVDVVLNSLPGEAIARGIAALADYGRFLEIGKRDIYGNARLGLRPFHKNLSFFAIDLDRVIRERPALLGGMLAEIAGRVGRGELEPLPHRAWPITEAAEAFRVMQQGRHIGKLVLTTRDRPAAAAVVPAEDEPLAFRADGTYLVTGGLGGFGLAVARWLAERGAGAIVLMGRRGAETPDAREAVAELRRHGARVVVQAADVAKEADVAAVLAAIDRDLPPLRGIFHAAMVLEDALLTRLDRDRMGRVLAPKVAGAWNLHAQAAGRSLDHFVMFSSLSSVFGHAGQASYAAANAFLDALAWHRRARGLPAQTVNWGHLGEVGYLAQRPELGERLERQGVLSFSVAQALGALETVLRRGNVQVSVMRVDWPRWRGLGVTSRVSPRFAHLVGQADGGPSDPAADGRPLGRDALMTASAADRPGLLAALLRHKVAGVLGTEPGRVDTGAPLLRLGIDSLMAMELRNWLEGELRVDLPIVELMRSPSLAGLAELLAPRLGAAEVDQSPGAGDHRAIDGFERGELPALDAAPAEILARIDELPGEQVDALLKSLLGEKTPQPGPAANGTPRS